MYWGVEYTNLSLVNVNKELTGGLTEWWLVPRLQTDFRLINKSDFNIHGVWANVRNSSYNLSVSFSWMPEIFFNLLTYKQHNLMMKKY